MAEMLQNERKESVLTEKDIKKAYMRWYNYCEVSNSYERMQTVSFCYAISSVLKKLYPKKEEYVAALQRHLNFFNSQGIWGSSLLGVAMALEEEKAAGKDISDETIINIKTGLMGPMAGIGDTIDWGTWKPLFFSIAASFSIQGGIAGVFICFLFALVPFLEGWYLSKLGYRLGRDAISKLLEGGWIKQLIMAHPFWVCLWWEHLQQVMWCFRFPLLLRWEERRHRFRRFWTVFFPAFCLWH